MRIMHRIDQRRVEWQMGRLKELLDAKGIGWEQHLPYVSFKNDSGECWVFPSQTHDGELCVRHTSRTRCETAEQALKACGVGDE